MEKVSVTCRLPAEDVSFLDELADVLERDRSYLIKKAVEEYITTQRWQLEEIERSLAEADGGAFASAEEVATAFDEFRS